MMLTSLNLMRYIGMILIAFSFPFGREITSPIITMWVCVSAIYEILKRSLKRNTSRLSAPEAPLNLLLLPVSYYLLCVLGLIYTEDIKQGIFELDKKIMFLAFPIFFYLCKDELDTSKVKNILYSFILGALTCCMISLFLGFYQSIQIVDGHLIFRTAINDTTYERGDSFFEQATQGGNYFFGSCISPFIHTTYYGIYLSMAILLSLFLLKRKRIILNLVVCSLLFTLLLFSDSKGALISFLLTLLITSLYFLKNKYVKLMLPILILGGASSLYLSPRTSLLISTFSETVTQANYQSTESSALRIILWKSAFDAMKKNWIIGAGTGDGKIAMMNETMKNNKYAHELELNAHNEYFETIIMLGVPGLLLLLAMLYSAFRSGLRNNKHIMISFIALVAFNMFFESMFQVFQGLVFFSFFYCLLTLDLYNKKNESITVG